MQGRVLRALGERVDADHRGERVRIGPERVLVGRDQTDELAHQLAQQTPLHVVGPQHDPRARRPPESVDRHQSSFCSVAHSP